MANNTIYAYGTGGELPEGIPVVNDDTTGGAGKAWSAERGKIIRQDLTALQELVEEGGGTSSTDITKIYKSKERNAKLINYYSLASFIFFTDIHRGWTNMARLVSLANAWNQAGFCTAVINGGDNIDLAQNDMSSYYTNMDDCNVDILQAVGNHDYAYQSNSRYARYIAPMVSRYTNLVQPANAETNDLCYYYKDFGELRVIFYDTVKDNGDSSHLATQVAWLDSVLDDALANSKHVMIVTHYPFVEADVQKYDNCNWRTWFNKPYNNEGITRGQTIRDDVLDVVDDFIDAGGNFCCWLTGHTHTMNFLTNSKYPKQAMFNLGTANYSKNVPGLVFDGEADNNYDNLCYVGVSKSLHCVFLMKVGSNTDFWMQQRDILVWDFKNSQLIDSY